LTGFLTKKGEIMVRKLIIALTTFFFVFSAVGVSLALEKGNKRKGKYTYRKVYKACFERGAVDSKVPPISPADKSQSEWEAIFTKKDYSQFGCEEEWSKLNDTQVTDIYTYLYEHASDSPTPAKCK
jgi:hypothetical protein